MVDYLELHFETIGATLRKQASGMRQGCSTLSIECPVEERICSGESGSISILTEC
jgi:hypothetical protein